MLIHVILSPVILVIIIFSLISEGVLSANPPPKARIKPAAILPNEPTAKTSRIHKKTAAQNLDQSVQYGRIPQRLSRLVIGRENSASIFANKAIEAFKAPEEQRKEALDEFISTIKKIDTKKKIMKLY